VVDPVQGREPADRGRRGLVRRGRHGWELSEHGREWVELLTYGQ
jgi:hypothetical protein